MRRAACRFALLSPCVLLCMVALWPSAARAATATSTAPADDDRRLLRVEMRDPAGKAIPKENIKEFYCADLDYEPLPLKIVLKNGEAVVFLPENPIPIQVTTLLTVPGFGEIHVFADNGGKGYLTPGRVDFVADAVTTRLNRIAALRHAGGKAEHAGDPAAAPGYERLAKALHVGEELTLAVARERIRRLPAPRKEFLFGCNAFGLGGRGPEYEKRFKELFNYGTANLYLTHYAPTETTRDFSRPDREVQWMISNGLEPTVCPPVYLANGVTPDWIKKLVYAGHQQVFYDLMFDAVKHYAGKVRFHEIVNEAHDFSNACHLTPAEFTDLTAVCSRATREGDPKAQRIINCCHLWGEYAAHRRSDGQVRRSPMRYLKDCIAAGVDFEIVGLQMYYPDYDLLEIDRMLDRYARLGKTIHISEMGCSSTPGIDPNAQRKKATAGWHGPWTEAMQADWVEGVYTLYYSKPYITAASWWDLADAVSFWPYGGLCRGDLSPKPSYLRLQALQRQWGLRK